MAQAKTAEMQVSESSAFASKVAGRMGATVVILLLLLSLISHNADDVQILAGGVGQANMVHNWIGRFGAYLSGILIAWLGFGVYPVMGVIIVCLVRRVFGTVYRKLNLLYFLAILTFAIGVGMLLGAFPELWPAAQQKLNLAHTPGGAIGQRFCAPGSLTVEAGWLAYLVDRTGCIIITSAMLILSLVTVWFFDWQQATKLWLAAAKVRWQDHRETAQITAEERAAQREIEEAERQAEEAERERERRDAIIREAASPSKPPALAAAPAPAKAPARASSKPTPTRQGKGVPALPSSRGELVNAPNTPDAPTHKPLSEYILPGIELLNPAPRGTFTDPKEIQAKKDALQETLESFGIDAQVGDATSGPRVTLFEVKPAPGVKVERIAALANNIAMNLRAESLRIQAPIPGKDTVGIEVPNAAAAIVAFREILESRAWKETKAALPIGLGKNIKGEHAILDLARCPHLLIAGATGAGKSVCMNTLILSLLYRFSPEDLKLIMVDPKVVEFSGYNEMPHLVTPVLTDAKKVPLALNWAVKQMEWRYRALAKVGVKHIQGFNSRTIKAEPTLDDDGNPIPDKLPYIVIIIDELADLMMTARGDVETSLARIAQLARAVGIHAVIATQRPSVDVLTGIIKANFPTRIAFQVSSLTDSRTILDGKGAESLLGRGDMLFKPPGGARLERTQGAMVADDEIERIVDFVKAQAAPQYQTDIFATAADKIEESTSDSGGGRSSDGGSGGGGGGRRSSSRSGGSDDISDTSGDSDEELLQKAIKVIMQDRRATTSHIQRRLRIGYNRAALIIEELERRGIIGPQIGTVPRDILIADAERDEQESDDEESDDNLLES